MTLLVPLKRGFMMLWKQIQMLQQRDIERTEEKEEVLLLASSRKPALYWHLEE